MNRTLFYLSAGGFLLLPPLLLWARFREPQRLPWSAVLALLAVGGWLFANATVYFYYEHLGALIERAADPPAELLERWAADGAKRVFALFFGWLYGLVYSAPFFLVYAVSSRFRRGDGGIPGVPPGEAGPGEQGAP